MAESDGQERTEDATARKLEQAREKGQVARSKELASVAVLVMGAVSLIWYGEGLGKALAEIMTQMFSLSREEMDFSYRHSILCDMPMVLISAKMTLVHRNKNESK